MMAVTVSSCGSVWRRFRQGGCDGVIKSAPLSALGRCLLSPISSKSPYLGADCLGEQYRPSICVMEKDGIG